MLAQIKLASPLVLDAEVTFCPLSPHLQTTLHTTKKTETILLALCFDLSAEMHHYKGHRKSLVLSNSKKIFVYLKPGTQKVSS